MSLFINRINMRYGRLLVVKHAGKDKKNRHLWLCKCDCGNEKIVAASNLSSGKSKGIIKMKKQFKKVINSLTNWNANNLWCGYKELNNETQITISQLKKLMKILKKAGIVQHLATFDKCGKFNGSGWFLIGRCYLG